MPRKVRDVMGLSEDEAADDRELEEVIRIAQEGVKRDLFIFHYNEDLTGRNVRGSTTQFQTLHYPIMDNTDTFTVTSSDVTVQWLNSSYSASEASWSIANARWGIVNIWQSDGATAIPNSAEEITIDYWSCPRSVTRKQLSDLTAYLAAHLTQHRLTSGTNISLADFQSNRPVIMKSETQFLKDYQMLLHNLQGCVIKGV